MARASCCGPRCFWRCSGVLSWCDCIDHYQPPAATWTWQREGAGKFLGVDDPVDFAQWLQKAVEGLLDNEVSIIAEELQHPNLVQFGQPCHIGNHTRTRRRHWCRLLNVHREVLCQPRQNHLDRQQTPNIKIRKTNPRSALRSKQAPYREAI